MRPFHAIRHFALALPFAFVVGCGDSTGPATALTEAEAAELLEVLNALNELSFGGGYLDPGASIRAVGEGADLTVEFADSAPCPNGGTTAVTGILEVDDVTEDVSVDVRQTYSDCRATSESGRIWTLNGNPNVRTQFAMSFNEETETVSGTGTISGGFRYSSNGKSGNCTINISMVITETSFSMTGTTCGVAVEGSGSTA